MTVTAPEWDSPGGSCRGGAMHRDRVILLVGQVLGGERGHRGYQLARCLSKRFAQVDLISVDKMHSGSGTDPVWKKGLMGARAMVSQPVVTTQKGNVHHHVARFWTKPKVLDYLCRDLWTYACLGRRLAEYYDLCILTHPRMAFVALKLKRQGKAGIFLYDDWDYFPSLYPHDSSWQVIMARKEEICVQRADAVVSVSRELQSLRTRQGARRTGYVPNGVHYAQFQVAQQKMPHPPTLLYVGSLGPAWGADLPILALRAIKERVPDVRYVVVGAGSEETRLRDLAAAQGLQDCVHLLGWREPYELPGLLAQADIGVATSRDTAFRRYACPLKIIEYMAAGLPVIGTPVGEQQLMIQESMAGETVEFTPEAFADAALGLLGDESKYRQYTANAINYAQEHDWERLVDQELALVEQLP